MAKRVQRHANVIKQATLLDEVGVNPLKWRVCGCGLNPFVHEGLTYNYLILRNKDEGSCTMTQNICFSGL